VSCLPERLTWSQSLAYARRVTFLWLLALPPSCLLTYLMAILPPALSWVGNRPWSWLPAAVFFVVFLAVVTGGFTLYTLLSNLRRRPGRRFLWLQNDRSWVAGVVTAKADGWHLSAMAANPRGASLGGEAIGRLTGLADRDGVVLRLQARRNLREWLHLPVDRKLVDFYARHGFVRQGRSRSMVRVPHPRPR